MRPLIFTLVVFGAFLAATIPASAAHGYYGDGGYSRPSGCYYYYHIRFRGAPSPQFLSTLLPRNDSWRYVYYYYYRKGR